MTELIKVYKGTTQEVVAKFRPGTPEGVMWRTLLAAGIEGSLRDRDGVWVARTCTDIAQGSYRLYDPKGGGQQL